MMRLQKLAVAYLLKNFHIFYLIQRPITVFTRTHYRPLFGAI
jgi:hypothetical protein